jgi:hypothetical protein
MTVKVKELIKFLQNQDPEAVVIMNEAGGDWEDNHHNTPDKPAYWKYSKEYLALEILAPGHFVYKRGKPDWVSVAELERQNAERLPNMMVIPPIFIK